MEIDEDRKPLRLAVPAQPVMTPKPPANMTPSRQFDVIDAETVTGWISTLAAAGTDAPDPARVNLVHALEVLKAAAASLQARVSVAFDTSQRTVQATAGLPEQELGKGIGRQLALARGEAPVNGNRLLGMAKALAGEMPHTLAALTSGAINEWRAGILVQETACLTLEDRQAVDTEIAADTGTLTGAGNDRVHNEARRIAARLDPASITARARKAEADRHVSCRPAPDTMTYLTGLLPVKAGVAVYAALSRHADALKSGGDRRARGQIMADTLVERITGTPGGISGIEIQLVMTDRTLLQGDSEPAQLPGYGIIGAQTARDLIRTIPPTQSSNRKSRRATAGEGHSRRTPDDAEAGRAWENGNNAVKVWLRRLYTAPGTGDLLAADSRRRLLPPPLRRIIAIRDDRCRVPYCGAPIRHDDHVIPWRTSHRTSTAGSQGLCVACNEAKEAPGWSAQPRPGPRHTVEITTPTGHTYISTAPPLPGTRLTVPAASAVRLSPNAGEWVRRNRTAHVRAVKRQQRHNLRSMRAAQLSTRPSRTAASKTYEGNQ
ncbi:MAG TPA: DUF222 domain-containing protein [Micrococcaceae bacterium]|jgi:hypothetical protein|nr:DUF222 domain-containing protein [Micrococcaceae bacterium]